MPDVQPVQGFEANLAPGRTGQPQHRRAQQDRPGYRLQWAEAFIQASGKQRINAPPQYAAENQQVTDPALRGRLQQGRIATDDDQPRAADAQHDSTHFQPAQPLLEQPPGRQADHRRVQGHDQRGPRRIDVVQAIEETQVVEKDAEEPQHRQLQALFHGGPGQRDPRQSEEQQQRPTGQQETQAGRQQGRQGIGQDPAGHEGTAPDHGDHGQLQVDRQVRGGRKGVFEVFHGSPQTNESGYTTLWRGDLSPLERVAVPLNDLSYHKILGPLRCPAGINPLATRFVYPVRIGCPIIQLI
ncbi:protein of unknown function [Pseudomonas mediterranea]